MAKRTLEQKSQKNLDARVLSHHVETFQQFDKSMRHIFTLKLILVKLIIKILNRKLYILFYNRHYMRD